MALSDGRATAVRVSDVVNLKDDHQYRVLKIIAPSGPIIPKRTDGSMYRCFVRTATQILVSAPQMVKQSTKLSRRLLLLTIPSLMPFYNAAVPMLLTLIIRAVSFVGAMFIGVLYPLKALHSSLWDTNYK